MIFFSPPPAGGVGGGGVTSETLLSDTLKHPFKILKNFVVPESQDTESIHGETGVPLLIFALGLRMLPTVKLYDDPFVKRYEVNDIHFDRLLTTEFYAFNLAVP